MYEETIDLSHLPLEGLKLERTIHPKAWKIHEPDWESRGDLQFEVLIKGSARKAEVTGKFSAGILAYCHRCLKGIELDLHRNFHLTYLPPDPARFSKEEVELTSEELEVAYVERAHLALHDMIREQVYLAVPMKMLCSADCQGLCTICGANLNQGACACEAEMTDPRWAALKGIVNQKK